MKLKIKDYKLQIGCMWMSEYEDCDGKFFIVRVAREGVIVSMFWVLKNPTSTNTKINLRSWHVVLQTHGMNDNYQTMLVSFMSLQL